MKTRILTLAALAALALSSTGHAAKPSPPTCRPTLPAPTGLAVVSDGTTITSTWNEVESVENEATKYGLEITAHYAAYADVTFAFTAFDDDAGVLNTDSFAIGASGLATTVCDDVECTTSTTHDAESVTVKVKGLIPPKKGKDTSQCNPFSESVTADVAVAESCPQACVDGMTAALAAISSGGTLECEYDMARMSGSMDYRIFGNTHETHDTLRISGGACESFVGGQLLFGVQFNPYTQQGPCATLFHEEFKALSPGTNCDISPP